MRKVYIRESLVEEAVAIKKAEFTSDMHLNMINGVSYKLTIAIKFLNEVANNETDGDVVDLSGLIISKDELIARNYDLFDDEIVADDRLYKVEIGYIGTLTS